MASTTDMTELSSDHIGNDDDSNYNTALHNNMYSTYDRSLLNNIDPDINYLQKNNIVNSDYYDEIKFNDAFKSTTNMSIIHLNIRSYHCTSLNSYHI